MAVTVEQVVSTIMGIRAKRAELKAAFTAEDEKLKEAEAKGELWLLTQLNAVGADSIKTPVGVVYKQRKRRSSFGDWNAFTQWAVLNNQVDMLQHRLNESAVGAYIEETGELPPGVSSEVEVVAVVRKS